MPRRLGMGPVFAFESLLGARRWQVYAGRALFVGVLLAGLSIVWLSRSQMRLTSLRNPTLQMMAQMGERFFYALAGVQLSLVLLAAPAAAAGAICMDRARGTLLHMMVTDLSDTEIVLGKLGSRLTPVFGMVACGVPVAALAGLLGGIDFGALAGVFVVSLALGVLGCALAMALSIRATKAHEVLMAVYLLMGLWLLALPFWWVLRDALKIVRPPGWFEKTNPYVLAFAPYYQPGFATAFDFAVFVAVVLAIAAALVGLTIARLRRSVIEQEGKAEQVRWRPPDLRWLFPTLCGPSLDGNPVLWREWHRNRPSRLARRLWGGLYLLTWAFVGCGTYGLIRYGPGASMGLLIVGFMLHLAFGMLMLSATAPTALAEERVRGSLDVLLATPLSTGSIVLAKWWGMFRRVAVLAVLPLFVAIVAAAATPDLPAWTSRMKPVRPYVPLSNEDRVLAVVLCVSDFLVSGAVLVSLGLALATWVRRLGRAVMLSVVVFLSAGIGWPIVVETLFVWLGLPLRNGWLTEILTSLSPLGGSLNALGELEGAYVEPHTKTWKALCAVVLIKAAVAGGLLALAVATFNHCLGRMAERSGPGRSRSPGGPRLLPRPAVEDRMDPLVAAASPRPDGPPLETVP